MRMICMVVGMSKGVVVVQILTVREDELGDAPDSVALRGSRNAAMVRSSTYARGWTTGAWGGEEMPKNGLHSALHGARAPGFHLLWWGRRNC